MADIEAIPFTTKEDFRDEYPEGLFAVDTGDVRRIHASSGTTGKPKVVGYTDNDLDTWADIGARSLYAAGVRPGDTVQNTCGYGLFTGGLGWHYAVERLGSTVIPIGSGNTTRQIEFINDLNVDAMQAMPSYALYLAEAIAESGDDPAALPVSTIPVGAEPSSSAMRGELAARFDALVTENYGLSELFGPGVATECATAQDGMHIWEDHFYPEVINPETGDLLAEGKTGELVLTSLTKEAVPLLRYRTGDMVWLTRDRCECGRTHARIHLQGRADDLLIIRGVNVYPTEIESVLLEFDALTPQYRIDLTREQSLDRIAITVERDSSFEDDVSTLRERLFERFVSVLSLRPDELDIVAYGDLTRSETGKTRHIYDHRK